METANEFKVWAAIIGSRRLKGDNFMFLVRVINFNQPKQKRTFMPNLQFTSRVLPHLRKTTGSTVRKAQTSCCLTGVSTEGRYILGSITET